MSGVEARLAAAVVHVAVRLRRALAVGLEHADEDEDLELAVEGDVVPLLLRRAARDVAAVGEELVLAGHEGRALRDEAEERGHGDAAVLDLGVAEPADRGLLADLRVARSWRARRVDGVLGDNVAPHAAAATMLGRRRRTPPSALPCMPSAKDMSARPSGS